MRVRCPVMVGRSAELEQLTSGLPGQSGRGAFILIGGEVGVGKTRLIEEFQAAAVAGGTVFLAGGCSQADIKFPYLPFVSALAQAHVSSEVLRERLGVHADALGAIAPRIATQAVAQIPKAMFFESTVMLLEALAGTAGLVLVVEDLHWADPGTAELTEYLARRIRTEPLLVIGTY